ncbi:MAG: hypothetical protein V3S98_05220, partial [Dehalococcoidia bacterium]
MLVVNVIPNDDGETSPSTVWTLPSDTYDGPLADPIRASFVRAALIELMAGAAPKPVCWRSSGQSGMTVKFEGRSTFPRCRQEG